MSEASELTSTPIALSVPSARLKHGKRLSEPQKRAIVAAVASGEPNALVAQQFGIHRNTVSELVRSVQRNVKDSVLSASRWRNKLTEEIPSASVDAIHASVLDREDVHKAATTGIAILKGIGVLASENSSTVNIFMNDVARLPADWKKEYFNVDDAQTVQAEDVTDTERT